VTRLAALLLAAALLAAGCGIDEKGDELAGSTREATIADADGDGALDRGPAERLVDRTELAPRGRATREVLRFGQLADVHVRDEESPARVPFLDRLGPPVTSTFRPQEALSPQVLTAAIRTLNAERPDAVLLTGDLLDSAQRNELDQLLAVLRGGPVDPSSGTEGYRGVQSAANPDGQFYRPDLDAPRHRGLLGRAQREYFSPGLRAPWFPALGNHDVLVQGELPPSDATDAIATGDRALLTFDPVLEDLLQDLPRGGRGGTPDLRDVPPEAIEDLLAGGIPGRTTEVPPDPRRRHLRGAEPADLLREAANLADAPGGPRLDYAADLAPDVRLIVLDTANRDGGARGVVGPEQVRFLRRELARAGDRSIVVVDHHGLDRSDGGEAARELLAGDDRVVAELTGDTHRNEIRPVQTESGGYWQITTGSLADWPQQGRMLRLVTGPDGERAIETWMVDHAGGLDAEDLAGAARELAFLDAQGGRPNGFAGGRRDRNARLWLPPLRSGG
jgi:3',5'-cyclic AMP phosphodiesterase CpdA